MARTTSPSISRRGLLASGAAALTLGNVARPGRGAPRRAKGAPTTVRRLPTPALLLDQDAFERNLKRMAEHAERTGIGLRPHAKTHKCPEIAKRQMALGAVGISCAKVSEAETMADAGLEKILITSPVATEEKVERVVAVAERIPELMMLVDHPDGVASLNAEARRRGVTVSVLIGLDTGTRRTGIPLGEPALRLARAIDDASHLKLRGLQAYAGHVQHVTGHAERAQASRDAMGRCLETKALLARNGFDTGIFSGGGTGTFDIDSGIEGVTDLQVGSYCFMDVQYRKIGDRDGAVFDAFEPSLFVLATAISQPAPDRITVDAGYKAFANEPNAKPEFADLDGLEYHYGGDEHGIVGFTAEPHALQRGDKARLLVSHCDPTVNLYDRIHLYRGEAGLDGEITDVWAIAARGRSQ